MKKILLAMLGGFLVGSTLTGLFSPSMIAWYFDPPTSIGVSCKDAVIWGISAYQKLLIVGGGIGLAMATIIVATRMGKSKNQGALSEGSDVRPR